MSMTQDNGLLRSEAWLPAVLYKQLYSKSFYHWIPSRTKTALCVLRANQEWKWRRGGSELPRSLDSNNLVRQNYQYMSSSSVSVSTFVTCNGLGKSLCICVWALCNNNISPFLFFFFLSEDLWFIKKKITRGGSKKVKLPNLWLLDYLLVDFRLFLLFH